MPSGPIQPEHITRQTWSSVYAVYTRCPTCDFVVHGLTGIGVDSPCSECGTQGLRRSLHFPMHILTLIDLMQDQYLYVADEDASVRNSLKSSGIQSNHLGVIISFCALWEALIFKFMKECMIGQGISDTIRNRLFEDNRFWHNRTGKLFKSLTGKKWNDVIRHVEAKTGRQHSRSIETFHEARRARNVFVHEGYRGHFDASLPKKCVDQIEASLWVFVDLHNEFIPGFWHSRVDGIEQPDAEQANAGDADAV